ncbi:hypothetical protein AB0I72_20060 [Nocardiopsis sp. NPDC049922]|uniref:hypothetical protein n=1 Tax=Nocardiopsis sp. NPDC049922 TaxID=3155157 RepID=UPI0033C6D670
MPIIAGDHSGGALLPDVGFATAVYMDPSGQVWPLTDTLRGWFTLADGVSGLGAAPYDLTTDAHPRGGVRLRHAQPQARTVVWPIHVYGQDHTEFIGRWRALVKAFTDTLRRGPGLLEIARPDGTRRRIAVYYSQGFDGQGEQGTGIVSDSAVLSLLCEDPYWIDSVPLTEHREHGTGEDFLQPYPSVSSGQVLGSTTLANPGDVVAWPQWTITGPASLVTFTQNDTGESFTVDPAAIGGSLLAHEQVTVSTDPPRVRKLSVEQQTINLGAATAGTITITAFGETTVPITYDADAATVQTALEGLVAVDPDEVLVTGGPLPATITLAFVGRYVGVDVDEVLVTPTGLTGGTVTVATTVDGGTANWVGALDWPGAELWPLQPGPNRATFQLDGSGPGSAVDLAASARYETA